jgi:hypothetical protein
MKKQRIIPRLTYGEYVVDSCGVCDIYNIYGSSPDLCTLHYSDPLVDYKYAYDYITLSTDGVFLGYYIGTDRFSCSAGHYDKEYVVYEYALFVEDGIDEAADMLFSHLSELARVTGCSRIICNKNGGNSLFNKHFADKGFTENVELLSLTLVGVTLSDYDRMVLPTNRDALGFDELFFLREQGFELDSEKCVLEINGESISVDRRTGACEFSEAFLVIGGVFVLQADQNSLGFIDVCRQLLGSGFEENIKIYLPSAKESELTPDILVDDIGIFISDQPTGLHERRTFRMRLREAGVIKKYAFYKLYFDYEVGGIRDGLAYGNV